MRHISYKSALIILLIINGLVGCATTNTGKNVDPLETFNRHMFTFNKDVDNMVLKPAADIYQAVVPKPLNKGVNNFFSNINDISVIFNDLLQLKFRQAGADTGRFLVNSTVGLLGVLDIATEVGLTKHEEDFGQTLGYWGVDSGPYLVLPLLGPSTARDAIGRGVDIATDPRTYLHGNSERIGTRSRVVEVVDTRAGLMSLEKVLDSASLDPYTYMRDAYLQRRKHLVYDGNPPVSQENEELIEDLFSDIENGKENDSSPPATQGTDK